jgi:hypothetical protein
MDKALARTPGERYQSVAQFSADVGQIVGTRPSGAAGDGEGKTQVIGAADKTRIAEAVPATRVATVEKKRGLMIPAAIGVVVLALAGGGYAVFGRSPAPVAPGGVTHDTTAHQLASNPNGGDTTRMSKRDTTRVPHPASHPGTQPGNTSVPSTAGLDPAKAHDALDDLFLERLDSNTASMVLDSAQRFFNAPAVSQIDKAYAAFVTGQAYFALKGARRDRTKGCDWIRRAIQLDPNPTYSRVISQCQS